MPFRVLLRRHGAPPPFFFLETALREIAEEAIQASHGGP